MQRQLFDYRAERVSPDLIHWLADSISQIQTATVFKQSGMVGELEIDVQQCNSLAIAMNRCEFRFAQGGPSLLEVCDRWCECIYEFGGPLQCIERDDQLQIAQLRTAPLRDADHRRYVEMMVDGQKSVVIQRFEKSPGETRANIPLVIGREDLANGLNKLLSSASCETRRALS